MDKEYLYHGSPVRVNKLIPNQAYDTGFEEGCQYAVYATPHQNMARCVARGCVEESENAERIMLPEYGDKMVFRNCHPNYGGKGYVYILNKEKFSYAMGSQWVCFEEIVPDEVIEINVDEYLDYCIIE